MKRCQKKAPLDVNGLSGWAPEVARGGCRGTGEASMTMVEPTVRTSRVAHFATSRVRFPGAASTTRCAVDWRFETETDGLLFHASTDPTPPHVENSK
jgi:hypothetical protein